MFSHHDAPPARDDAFDGDTSLEMMSPLETVSSDQEDQQPCPTPCSCFARFRAELAESRQCTSSQSFSTLDPGTDQIIYIPSSFGPAGLLVLLWKSGVGMWILSCLILGITDQANQGHVWMYFVFLTNWSVMASLLYISCSFFNSAVTTPRQPAADDEHESCSPSRWICFTWILFEIAAHTDIAVTLLYWSSIREPGKTIVYAECMPHGIVVMLVLIDGLVVNRIPVRVSHLWQFVVWFDLFYMIFTAIYEFSGMGTGLLYPTAQWKDDFTGTLVRDLLALIILCPILYVFLYTLSVLSWRRYCLQASVSRNEDINAYSTAAASESDNIRT
jgi:hypothetical protein